MASSADAERGGKEGDGAAISVVEWQGWGTSSPVTATVLEVIEDIKALARDSDAPMTFGGLGGKLKGTFKDQEDKKHRSVYESICDSENKMQFFSARQIACRLLGNRGHLCQKDFLRQNNTGKLLWQIFGIQSAALCLFGICEHEDIMWSAFRDSGKGMVWFLYPNQNSSPMSVEDLFSSGPFTGLESQKMDLGEKPLNFVLIDGTWSNSSAMHRRLKERWALTWGEEHLPCISLSTLGASVMHKLRPQPSWDRTCTAAAAAGILWELHLVRRLSMYGLEKQAEAVENALDVLLDALVQRRLRKGRSITRKERHNNCI
ncbi:DTW domain [Musa troglodytarum]|uniref:tRNA-uridine aminocarboxypropyltransferase n=1 Tax=Musa troglodytarum TaxID=320322 RepID=A0A9E7F2F6_9LILI|nr:DTW domain [Musa troglodytarum]URD86399.1 DTW domain [Musa troglodytarum]